MPVAETERLILRCFNAGDAEAMEVVFCCPEVMRYSDGMQSPEWVRAWIAEMIEAKGSGLGLNTWAIVEKSAGEVIGYCGLSRCPERCGADETELGYRLARARWGRGFASEAARAVRDPEISLYSSGARGSSSTAARLTRKPRNCGRSRVGW